MDPVGSVYGRPGWPGRPADPGRPATDIAVDCEEKPASRELLNGPDTIRLPLPRQEFSGAVFLRLPK